MEITPEDKMKVAISAAFVAIGIFMLYTLIPIGVTKY